MKIDLKLKKITSEEFAFLPKKCCKCQKSIWLKKYFLETNFNTNNFINHTAPAPFTEKIYCKECAASAAKNKFNR